MLKLCQIFGFPKLLLWHNSRRTYLAHLMQCVLACPAFRGWNKCWRQGKDWIKERESAREMGKAYTLTQRGGKGIPLWARWVLHLAGSECCSGTLQHQGCMRFLHLCFRLVKLTAKTKKFQRYSFRFSNYRTLWPKSISASCHFSRLETFGFSFMTQQINAESSDPRSFIFGHVDHLCMWPHKIVMYYSPVWTVLALSKTCLILLCQPSFT